jgi:hypothetical protein
MGMKMSKKDPSGNDGHVEPREISEDRYLAMLESRPPRDWVVRPGIGSFHMIGVVELGQGQIFANIGNRFFELWDRPDLTHGEILGVVRKHFGALDE